VKKLVTETRKPPIPAGIQVLTKPTSDLVIVRVTICRPVTLAQRLSLAWAQLRGREAHETHHEVLDFPLPAEAAHDFAVAVYKAAEAAKRPTTAAGTRPS
jgi:hypothetical protein